MNNSKIRFILTLIVTVCVVTTYFAIPVSAESTTWFSQYSHTAGTGWDTSLLDNLYFPNMPTCSDCGTNNKCANTPLYAENLSGSDQLNKGHMNKWGCSICSVAMIFRNMNARSSAIRKDFRTGHAEFLQADPFTVMLSNISWQTPKYNSDTHRYEMLKYLKSESPVYPYWATLSSGFGKTAHKYDLSGKTTREKADALAYYIGKIPRVFW